MFWISSINIRTVFPRTIDIVCFAVYTMDIIIAEGTVFERWLRDAVITSIKDGCLYFGTGGALGYDTLAAQTVLELKQH